MSTWADFYPELMPSVLGCPYPTADAALRAAAREFLERTRLWREWLDPVTVLPGVREYSLDLPFDSMVVRIERCTANGADMPVLSHNAQASDYTRTEQPEQGIVSRDRSTFTLTQAMPAGTHLAAEVSLMPSTKAKGLPDGLFFQHYEDILAGAKHRLMLIPETSFSNGDLAMFFKNAFESAVATKTVTAWKGATGTTPRPRVGWV